MPRLSFSGFDRRDEDHARALFESAGCEGWSLSDEASADAVLIDLDSMYGQMAWMKGIDAGKVSIGLTAAARADTAYRLDAPLQAEALASLLAEVAQALTVARGATPAEPMAPIADERLPAVDVAPTISSPPATAIPEVAATPPAVPTTVGRTPGGGRTLADHLREASAAFAVEAEGLPRLVIDPRGGRFAPGKSLKALAGYGLAALDDAAIHPVADEALPGALAAAGEAQPLGRLTWLLALAGGGGRVQGHSPDTRFALDKWPQVEREFPKHFRIATVMLKGPGTVAELAAASGASDAEVADYVNAALAAGHARTA